MMTSPEQATHKMDWIAIERVVESFERKFRECGEADVADYAPSTDDTQYVPIVSELIRVDLELRWSRGEHPTLESYQEDFPKVFEDQKTLSAIAYEHYRLHCQAGEKPPTSEYTE
jgi:eukaryotic-like serine/threonine-protein kinase